MKQKEIAVLVLVGFVAAIVSLIVSGAIFSPKKYSSSVPAVQKISSEFPDVKNDSAYSSFMAPGALDLTVPIETGNNQNPQPFNP